MADASRSTETLTRHQQAAELSAYHRELAALLAPIIDRKGAWADLVELGQGATPVDIARALDASGAAPPDDWPECEVACEQPELHLADAEWYFSHETAKEIAEAIRPTTGRIACIGTPTVARILAAADRRPVLIDQSDALRYRLDSKKVDLIHCDAAAMRDGTGHGTFASVVFDAPWHLDEVTAWLWHASRLARTGARIAFALFPPLAKPTARDERLQILELCEGVGRVWITPAALEYDTPAFERAAFRAAGVPAPTRWRRADLVEVTRRRALSGAPPRRRRQFWATFIIGPQVVKIRRGMQIARDGVLPRVPGTVDDVLPSVSRAHPGLPYVDLWTSRNRVSSIGDRPLVTAWLAALAAGTARVSARSLTEEPVLRRLERLLDI